MNFFKTAFIALLITFTQHAFGCDQSSISINNQTINADGSVTYNLDISVVLGNLDLPFYGFTVSFISSASTPQIIVGGVYNTTTIVNNSTLVSGTISGTLQGLTGSSINSIANDTDWGPYLNSNNVLSFESNQLFGTGAGQTLVMNLDVTVTGCVEEIKLDASVNSGTSGCEFTIPTNITPPSPGIDTQVSCGSYTWTNGITYTSSNNTASITTTSSTGCDSTVFLNLTIHPNESTTDTQIACDNYTWINGTNYTINNNTAQVLLTTIYGCDSLVSLDLTINNSINTVDSQVECDNYTWTNGINYTSSNNTAIQTLQTISGCDSIVTLNLTINNFTTGIDTQSSCDNYTWIDGNNYSSSNNSATHTLQTLSGCDSVVTLDLTINNSSSSTDTQISCDNYTWINGVNYTSSNNSQIYTIQNSVGCDSTISLNLTINNSATSDTFANSCDSLNWYGTTYYNSGNYTETLQTIYGCDSIVTLNLTINNSTSGDTTATKCDSIYWYGNTYFNGGNYTHLLQNSAGCDSLLTLNVTINNSDSSTDTQISCNNYTWIDGNTYSSNNNSATFTLQTIYGCDSLVSLDLTIVPPSNSTDSISACDSITWIDGNSYSNNNNLASFTTTNIFGCDSVISLNLTISSSYQFDYFDTICSSELPFNWNGLTFNNEDSQVLYLNSSENCDSTISFNLSTFQDPQVSINIGDTSICADSSILLYGLGANSFSWSNNIIDSSFYFPTQSGDISVTGTDINNCSSTSTVNIGIDTCYYDPFEINIPNIFTPDNDGNNDIFYISGTNYIFKAISILNRWGETIFKTQQERPWDGRLYSGQKAPEGSYFYILDITKYDSNIPTDTTYKQHLFLSR